MQTLTDIGTMIVRTPRTCGGRVRIAGSRIAVQFVVNEISAGITSEVILGDTPHLSLAGIYASLAFYYANRTAKDDELAAYEEESRRPEAELSIA